MKRLFIFLCVCLLASNICAFTTHLNSYNLALLQHQQQQLQLQQQQQQLLQREQQLQQDQQRQQQIQQPQHQQGTGSDSSDSGNDYGSMSSAGSSEDYDTHPQYSFAYNVRDALTGDDKQQEEQRNGDLVLGQYSVVDPDGTRRTVEYTADDINGFNAVVSRQNIGGLRTSYAASGLGSSSNGASSSSRFNSFEAMQAQIEAQNIANQQRSPNDIRAQNQANSHAQAMSQIQQQTEMQAKVQAETQQRIQAQQLIDQFQQQYRQQQQQVQRSQQQLLRARAQSNVLNHSLQATVIAHPLLSRTNSLTLAQPALFLAQPASASATAQAQLLQPYLDTNSYTTLLTSRDIKSQW